MVRDSNSGHQLLLPPANWCLIFASRTTQGQPKLGCDMVCFQTYPGCDTAVYFDWIGEDSGPNVASAADVLALYAKARARFPGAEVSMGSLDDIVDALLQPAARAALPTLTGEIGDTWSYGIQVRLQRNALPCAVLGALVVLRSSEESVSLQSDPQKTRDLRLLMRHRSNYSAAHAGLGDHMAEPAIITAAGARAAGAATPPAMAWWSNFSRLLLKGYEHTWGGLAQPDPAPAGFVNANFHRDRGNGTVATSWIKSLEQTWTDQRTWAVDMAMTSIGDPALRAAIESERAIITQKELLAEGAAGKQQHRKERRAFLL